MDINASNEFNARKDFGDDDVSDSMKFVRKVYAILAV